MNDLTYQSHSTAKPGIILRRYLYATAFYFIAIVLPTSISVNGNFNILCISQYNIIH